MSTPVGDRLPPDLVEAFNGDDLEAKIGPGYLFVTSDEDGAPRPCMLSAGEVLATDDRHLRLALWSGSHTSANLSRGAPSLFCYVAEGTVLYVRGTPRALGTVARLQVDCFEIEVSIVESDEHPGMPVHDTIRFTVTGRSAEALVREWQQRLAALGSL